MIATLEDQLNYKNTRRVRVTLKSRGGWMSAKALNSQLGLGVGIYKSLQVLFQAKLIEKRPVKKRGVKVEYRSLEEK